VLADLATFHAANSAGLYLLAYFDRTGMEGALHRSGTRAVHGGQVWEELVKRTDGVYPPNMAFGPEDVGHWKDKLPYVRYDVEHLKERREILQTLWPVRRRVRLRSSRALSALSRRVSGGRFVLRNSVEPRFTGGGCGHALLRRHRIRLAGRGQA
jgi:hypothetical protein